MTWTVHYTDGIGERWFLKLDPRFRWVRQLGVGERGGVPPDAFRFSNPVAARSAMRLSGLPMGRMEVMRQQD